MILKDHRVEPISTAPHHQGLRLRVILRGVRRNDVVVEAYWWRHWSMAEGCWWSMDLGVVDPIAWISE